ncbi:indolepyruvate decarboxylase [Enterobacterales bacterium CwR94]|nr:indolepyruvate decarboxylase [Enterobacterales bacterium CwR94]
MGNITVGDYLLHRLDELGIEHLFGVPGDYNLQFLDHVIAHPRLAWVGCANELNAAYAADGYARCRGAAALLTTFGVGELSAINGIAGSYAEYLPVIHIVGAPSLQAQSQGDLIHHSLGDGDFGHFARMHREVSVAQAILQTETACQEIDRVLTDALHYQRPGYLVLSTTVAESPAVLPDAPLRWRHAGHNDRITAFSQAVQPLFAQAKRVSLLADFLADRYGLASALNQWMAEVPLAHATLLMGKGVFDEQREGFVGTYAGEASACTTRQAIEEAELIITVGVKFTDTITAGFTQHIETGKVISVMPDRITLAGKVFSGITQAEAVACLHRLSREYAPFWPRCEVIPAPLPEAQQPGMTQSAFWQAIQQFLRPDDILVVEQGTAAFGAFGLRLPSGVKMITQPLWGSIGYTLPAAFGAQTAQPARRVILIIGDGSAQLTAQELGSMMRDGLTPIIFLLNNAGYSVERAIHGAGQRYNDIAPWNWTQLPQALSTDCPVESWRVCEPVQLAEVMTLIATRQRMSLVEVVLPKEDIPPLLAAVTRSLHQRNSANQES